MRINQAKALIKNITEKNLHVPVMLVGSMGIGKSNIVKQVAEELGVQLIDLRLAQQEPGDLIGIPREINGVTSWAKPEWWPKEGTRGILFLDELNRAPVDVRQAAFQLVNEWRMHTHVLPDGWYIVSAINPDNGNYQVETLDPAMLRRFCVLKVVADVDSWMEWALDAGKIDRTITGFVNAHRQLLLGINDDITLDIKPTPDQYRMLNLLYTMKVIPPDLEPEVFSGLIGHEAAIAFRRWLDAGFVRPVSGREILEKYAKVAVKVKKQKNDEMYTTISDLGVELGQLQKLSATELQNVLTFLDDIAPEFKATFASKLPTHLLKQFVTNAKFTESIEKVIKTAESKTK